MYAALFMVAGDIPAAKKVCGYTSLTSTNTSHKFNCQFSQLFGTSSVGYSGFYFSKWLFCTKNDNCKDVEVWRNSTTKIERHCLEVEDDVHCTTIDSMHSIFLETTK